MSEEPVMDMQGTGEDVSLDSQPLVDGTADMAGNQDSGVGYAVVPIVPKTHDNTVIEYIVIPLAALVFIGLVVFLIVWICRRNKEKQPPEEDGEAAPLDPEAKQDDVPTEVKTEIPAEEEQ